MHTPPTLDELEKCRQMLVADIDSETKAGDIDTKEIRASKKALKEIERMIEESRANLVHMPTVHVLGLGAAL